MSFMAALLGGLGAGVSSGILGSLGGSPDPKKREMSMVSPAQGPVPPTPGNLPPVDEENPTTLMSVLNKTLDDVVSGAGSAVSSQALKSLENSLSGGPSNRGSDYRAALSGAFPELNPWELSGSSAGGAMASQAGVDQAKELKRMEFDNQQKIVDKQLDNQYKIAELGSATSMSNTAMQVKPAMEMLELNKTKAMMDIEMAMSNVNLSDAQLQTELERKLLTMAQTTGAHASAEQARQQAKLLVQQRKNISSGDTIVGKNKETIDAIVGEYWDPFINFIRGPQEQKKAAGPVFLPGGRTSDPNFRWDQRSKQLIPQH